MSDANAAADRAERSLLGSMLRSNPAIADTVRIVREEDFRADAHRKVYASIVALWDRGKPVDMVTLADELHRRGQIADIGDYGYLTELWDASPTAANAEYYAGLVRDQATYRRLEQAGHEIARDASGRAGPPDDLLEQAERRIFGIAQIGLAAQTVTLDEAMGRAFDRIEARSRRDTLLSGIPTGFLDLDRILAGLQDSELVVIAARPGVGKTAMGLAVTRHVALKEKLPVFFVSLEQSAVELADRILSSEGNVDGQRIRLGRLSAEDGRAIVCARDRLRQARVFIDDAPAQSMLRIAASARRLSLKHGVRLIVVDYLQLITPDNRKEPRQEQVAGISRRLKQLAREIQVPVVALAQLNRGVEDRQGQRPRLSDLRESGAIEADADTVLLLHPGDHPAQVEVIVAKQRNGPVGEVTLAFERPYQRFANAAIEPLA
jgi:replicative DNA helicase